MTAIKISSAVTRAQVFPAKEEGWSEQVALHVADEFDGFTVDDDGVKTAAKVSYISVFKGDVIKALSATNAQVGAFLSAKSADEKLKLLPIILNGAKIEFTRELTKEDDVEMYLTAIEKIEIDAQFLSMIQDALKSLFMF